MLSRQERRKGTHWSNGRLLIKAKVNKQLAGLGHLDMRKQPPRRPTMELLRSLRRVPVVDDPTA